MTWHCAPPRTPLRKAAAPPDTDTPPLRALVDAAQPALVAALRAALTTLGTDADAEALRAALLSGDVGLAVALLAGETAVALLEPLTAELLTLMQQTSTASLPSVQAALSHLQTTQDALLATTTQRALPVLVQTAQSWQLPVATTARLVQAMVGLTAPQVRTLTTYRAMLLDEQTPPARLTPLVTQRIAALQAQRAQRIAQTVSMQAVNAAQRLQWQQAVQQGQVDGTRLRRFWIVGPDPCTQQCAPIPGLNPDGRALGEPFAMPGGVILDPPVHPTCYCTIDFREV
jgi:hypothetical protein